MSHPEFRIDESVARLTLAFRGRLDSAGCATIHDAVQNAVQQAVPGQALRFDLAGSDFVASAFLRLCILAAKQVGGERFELANLAPAVREVFVMAGLDQHLRIVESAAT